MNALRLPLITGFAMLLTACGGGGSDAPPPTGVNPPPTGGIGRTGVAVGPISNFGSVVVNGVRYDTSGATFTVDDAPGSESDLAVGQVVIVKGEIDADGVNGTADEVIYDDDVEGPIASIDLAAGTFTVLGLTVIVDDNTSFEDGLAAPGLAGLAVDDLVEVSGLFDANGDLVATRVERKDDNDDFERKGIVAALDAANFTFELGTLEVDYSGATLEDFGGMDIQNGDLVEVEGTLDPNDANRLIASKVEREDPLGELEDGDDVEIEGFITRFVDETDFDVSGLPVTTTAATVYEGGTAADLGLNIKVEVEGEINANGVLVAEEIELRADTNSRVTAQIDSIDAAAGTLTVLGVPISTDALTRFEDQSSDDDGTPLTLGDLVVGDYVEVRGSEFPAESNAIVASRVELEDLESTVELRGFVDSVSEPNLSVLGVTIETAASTTFRDGDEQPISATEFFSLIGPGTVIEAEGVESSDTVLIAEEIEIEND